MIELSQVRKIYKQKKRVPVTAVAELNLMISPGEFLVITGRSGCGKTTVLNIIAGLARPTSGSLLIDGTDVWTMDDKEISTLRNEKMGFMFQVPSLIPTLTVLDNVVVPTMFTRNENQGDVYERAAEALESVGLSHRLEAYPRYLSAGEEKRVVIARSIINRPPILLADEPTANLDELTERDIMALIEKIHGEGTTIILVTHHPSLIGYGTRHLTMADGRLVL
ncbi:MAG: ABC transporter ATP-binding protein [Thermodesulfobacteriota bacterium]|nr:ABC transporter ATP-binding protein [Thermodesulfobacteriota bacterium]